MSEPITESLPPDNLPHEVSEGVPVYTPAYPLWVRLRLPILIVVFGLILISASTYLDSQETAKRSWVEATIVFGVPVPEEVHDALPLRARQLPLPDNAMIAALNSSAQGKDILRGLDLHGEWVIELDAAPKVLAPLLTSGRLPEAGKREAVAGYLVKANTFELDGQTYTVTGRLHRSVGALGFAYVLPKDSSLDAVFNLEKTSEIKTGWITPKSVKGIFERSLKTDPDKGMEVQAAPGRSARGVIMLTFMGLILVSIGGSCVYLHVFRAMKNRFSGPMTGPLLQAMIDHPLLLAAAHILLYGIFFQFMALGISHPVLQLHLLTSVQHQFTEGGLSNIGIAYASGNVIAATAATFVQNYIVATIFGTYIPSLIIPFAGIGKNLLSFALVGFVMAPTEINCAGRLIYHSITMVLEFEAYIVAVFVITLWPVLLVKGLRDKKLGENTLYGLRLQASGALLCGVMLLIAAFYEAVSLIYLGGV